jgi:hypothetical protein
MTGTIFKQFYISFHLYNICTSILTISIIFYTFILFIMIYLIGVDHLVQYNGPIPESIRDEFRSYIITLCRIHDIAAIAEEFSEEALREVYHATKETAREAATLLGICHRYCDPEEKELTLLGIPFYADVLHQIKNKYSIAGTFILDDELRKMVTRDTMDIVRSYWHIREEYWYSRIFDIINVTILFICGHEHVMRFQSLLHGKGCQCHIIDSFWKEELFRDYGNLNLV